MPNFLSCQGRERIWIFKVSLIKVDGVWLTILLENAVFQVFSLLYNKHNFYVPIENKIDKKKPAAVDGGRGRRGRRWRRHPGPSPGHPVWRHIALDSATRRSDTWLSFMLAWPAVSMAMSPSRPSRGQGGDWRRPCVAAASFSSLAGISPRAQYACHVKSTTCSWWRVA